MSEKQRKIRENLSRIAQEYGPDYVMDANVLEVYQDSYTCDVKLQSDDTVIYGCRLRATSTENTSIDVLPAVGCNVVISKLSADDYLVLACDEITSYRVSVSQFVIGVNESGIALTSGSDSLKQILTDFVNGVLSIYAPKDVAGITALLERINVFFQ